MLSISQLQKKRRDDEGFTLIELLVVVVILGILIAIAIPVYLNYRKSANDKAAQSDLRNAVATLEVCNSDGGYPTGPATLTGTLTGCTQTVTRSDNTTFTYYPKTDGTAYIVLSTNSGGSKTYCYASAAGGGVKERTSATAVSAYAATCA